MNEEVDTLVRHSIWVTYPQRKRIAALMIAALSLVGPVAHGSAFRSIVQMPQSPTVAIDDSGNHVPLIIITPGGTMVFAT